MILFPEIMACNFFSYYSFNPFSHRFRNFSAPSFLIFLFSEDRKNTLLFQRKPHHL